MDGFQFSKRPFIPRELGYVAMDSEEVDVVSFDLSGVSTNENDWKSVRYCRKFVHGLPFYPLRGERCQPPENLDELLLNLYREYRSSAKHLVAYKGGVCEKYKLEELGIPCINLEQFGCPKYEHLKEWYPDVQGTCWRHDKSSNRTYHCVAAEVQTFKSWVKDNLVAAHERSMWLRTVSGRRLSQIKQALAG